MNDFNKYIVLNNQSLNEEINKLNDIKKIYISIFNKLIFIMFSLVLLLFFFYYFNFLSKNIFVIITFLLILNTFFIQLFIFKKSKINRNINLISHILYKKFKLNS